MRIYMTGKPSLFYNNRWQTGHGQPFDSKNPVTGKTIWSGQAAILEDIDHAIDAARKASPSWFQTSLEDRIAYLKAYESLLNKQKSTLAEAISIETGKALWESKTEVASMAAKIDISIQAYKDRCPELAKDLPNARSITRHHPHGVLAIFGPYNFPGHLPNGHLIPALLAGNTVIFKPSELTPLVAELMTQLWESAGLPKGVFGLIQGGPLTGHTLANHSGIDGLLFTGSWKTGHMLGELFAKNPGKILALEMGGNNPLVVSQVEDLQAAAYMTVLSAYMTAGQRCTCARRLIVPKGRQGDAFIDTLKDMILRIRTGAYTDKPEPFMGSVITPQAAAQLLRIQESWEQNGGYPIVEMKLLQEGTGLLSPGLIDVTAVSAREDEEWFGPLLQLIRVSDFTAALDEANATTYGLSAGLLSDSREEYDRFYSQIRAGIINWNTPLTGASSGAPFGGIGRSGNFRPSAYYAADYCAFPVASMETSDLKMPEKRVEGIDV